MGLLLSTRRATIRDNPYTEKVEKYQPLAYWPLTETSGTVATEVIHGWNGTYVRNVATMGTQAGIGDGHDAPTFDGANDGVNIYSAALAAAWNSNLGTAMCWARVSAAGVWTDAADRHIWRVQSVVGTDWIWHRKNSVNNQWHCQRRDDGGIYTTNPASGAPTAWLCVHTTWNRAGNQTIWYVNATRIGNIVACGDFSGALDRAVIGSGSIGPVSEVWSGPLAHMAIWTSVLPAAAMLDLATVE